VAILDGYSRKVLAWVLGTSREAMCCVGGLEEALRRHDRPSIFNTDPGLQNTRAAFTRILEAWRPGGLEGAGVAISRDGPGDARQPLFVPPFSFWNVTRPLRPVSVQHAAVGAAYSRDLRACE